MLINSNIQKLIAGFNEPRALHIDLISPIKPPIKKSLSQDIRKTTSQSIDKEHISDILRR